MNGNEETIKIDYRGKEEQLELLEHILLSNEILKEILYKARSFEIDNYYVGAGCITQTVWNYFSDNPLNYGIKDIDFVYFDSVHADYESENGIILKVKDSFSKLNVEIDIKNQARVHLWYKEHFGYEISPYESLEAAINTWPTTATAIGVRMLENDKLHIYAPFGLKDLLGKIVRPNKIQITQEIYEIKVNSWLHKWPDLKIISWE